MDTRRNWFSLSIDYRKAEASCLRFEIRYNNVLPLLMLGQRIPTTANDDMHLRLKIPNLERS